MEEATNKSNTEAERAAAPPAETPREVVLRYAPSDPREVVERYVPPADPPRAPAEAVAAETVAPDVQRYHYTPGLGSPERRGGRKALIALLACIALLFVALGALGRLYWHELHARRGSAEPAAPRYEWRDQLDAYADAETTIERYPNGGDTRLRYAVAHGTALDIGDVYSLVNPCTVTVATTLPGGGAIIGTGVIFTEDGYILTNAHVIEGGEQCYVVLDTGRSFSDVKLVGYDTEKDLAVIKVDAHQLPVAEFGDSDALSVGDTVYAIGNPLGVELRGTLTDGIVSAINRDVNVDGVKMTLIQTNAALNNGNSGGPLINIYGQVVGINTMKMGSSSAVSVEGLGFAIPISSAAWMVNDLIAYGEIHSEPVLGITVLREPIVLSTGETALAIYELVPNGPSDKAGLRPNDLILGADGEPVASLNDLLRIRRRYCAGETLMLAIERDGERFPVDVTLARLDD